MMIDDDRKIIDTDRQTDDRQFENGVEGVFLGSLNYSDFSLKIRKI